MTKEEALEKLNELAGGEGQDEVYERGEVAADGEPRLVYDAVKSNDQGYFSPLGKTTLQVGIELPAVKHADAALQERIGQCYLKLASIQKQLEKEPLAYDTTPELKAEYEEKLARLEGLNDAPEGSMEKVFYQTYQNWMETRENYHSPLFGCEASALHEGLAAAVAKADHYQHPELPEKMLAEYDPFLVSTDSLSAEQLAATVAGNMWQRLADQRASAEAVSTPKLVYSTVTDDLVGDQLEFFFKCDRSNAVYDFLEWRSQLTDWDWENQPDKAFEYLENLYDCLVDAGQMDAANRPNFGAIEEADANDVYMLAALASRIDTSKNEIQNVVKQWMQDNAYNLSVWEEGTLEDQARAEIDNALYDATRYSPASAEGDNGLLFVMPDYLKEDGYTPAEVLRIGSWQDGHDGEFTQDIQQFFSDYFPDTGFTLMRYPYKALSLTVEGEAGNRMLVIPDAHFDAIMKENPDLLQGIRARAIEAGLEDTESRIFAYYLDMTHELPREVLENRLENQLLDTKYLTAGSRDAMLDIVLTVPPEHIHKRVENLMKEERYGFETAFREAMYARHPIDRTRPAFQALQDLAKNAFTDENASNTLKELAPRLVGRESKARKEALDTLSAYRKDNKLIR